MPEQLVTRALLARTVNYGESDRVCTLLTEDHGKLSAIAKSARRSRRRFGGALSVFVLGRATLLPRIRSDMLMLEGFDSLEDLGPGISADVVKMAHGSYMLEVVRELWPEGQAEPVLFRTLWQALKVLCFNPPARVLLRAFELQVLSLSGFLPSLERCVSCGGHLDTGALGFNVNEGGLVCSRCGPHGWP
ncbi:MAG: DNA repair protein RecO, partial [Pseudomonadota bacterium]